MPAYKVPITQHGCAKEYCGKKATHEVYNTRNALMGRYCGKHANERVRELNGSLRRDRTGDN
jgi:hypothetical protein